MNLKKFSSLLIAGMVTAAMALSMSTAKATGAQLYDDFNALHLLPHPNAQWHIINWGDVDPFRFVDYCGTSTCVEQKVDNGVTYVELSHTPGDQDGFFTSGEVSELETGFAYGQPTQWTPTYGHPIELEFRGRWSENFNIDGTGGAMGSNGVWLWNSPVDLPNNTFHPQTAFGFSWAPSTSPYGAGLSFIALYENVPVALNPVALSPAFDINMHDWNTFKVVWETNVAGVQMVKAYINDELVTVRPLVTPMSNLSITAWHDNSTLDATGAVNYPAIQQNQEFDIDYLSLKQL